MADTNKDITNHLCVHSVDDEPPYDLAIQVLSNMHEILKSQNENSQQCDGNTMSDRNIVCDYVSKDDTDTAPEYDMHNDVDEQSNEDRQCVSSEQSDIENSMVDESPSNIAKEWQGYKGVVNHEKETPSMDKNEDITESDEYVHDEHLYGFCNCDFDPDIDPWIIENNKKQEWAAYIKAKRKEYSIDPDYKAAQAEISRKKRAEERANPKEKSQAWWTNQRKRKKYNSSTQRQRDIERGIVRKPKSKKVDPKEENYEKPAKEVKMKKTSSTKAAQKCVNGTKTAVRKTKKVKKNENSKVNKKNDCKIEKVRNRKNEQKMTREYTEVPKVLPTRQSLRIAIKKSGKDVSEGHIKGQQSVPIRVSRQSSQNVKPEHKVNKGKGKEIVGEKKCFKNRTSKSEVKLPVSEEAKKTTNESENVSNELTESVEELSPGESPVVPQVDNTNITTRKVCLQKMRDRKHNQKENHILCGITTPESISKPGETEKNGIDHEFNISNDKDTTHGSVSSQTLLECNREFREANIDGDESVSDKVDTKRRTRSYTKAKVPSVEPVVELFGKFSEEIVVPDTLLKTEKSDEGPLNAFLEDEWETWESFKSRYGIKSGRKGENMKKQKKTRANKKEKGVNGHKKELPNSSQPTNIRRRRKGERKKKNLENIDTNEPLPGCSFWNPGERIRPESYMSPPRVIAAPAHECMRKEPRVIGTIYLGPLTEESHEWSPQELKLPPKVTNICKTTGPKDINSFDYLSLLKMKNLPKTVELVDEEITDKSETLSSVDSFSDGWAEKETLEYFSE